MAVDFQKHPAWLRLEDQASWYDKKSVFNQKRFKLIARAQIIITAIIPFISLVNFEDDIWLDYSRWSIALLAIIVVIITGLEQLNQHSKLWVGYRSTAERLKHEKYLFLSDAGPYADLSKGEALKLLAERVEENISTEHAKWIRETTTNIKKIQSKEKTS